MTWRKDRSGNKLPIGYYLLILLFAYCSCSTSLSPEEEAAQAALSYYNRLIEGYPDGLLAAKAGYDAMPASYRKQMAKVYEQYVADMTERHGGLCAVRLSGNAARRDSAQNVTYTFLILSFNDSTQEEITVPMTQRDGEWVIK